MYLCAYIPRFLAGIEQAPVSVNERTPHRGSGVNPCTLLGKAQRRLVLTQARPLQWALTTILRVSEQLTEPAIRQLHQQRPQHHSLGSHRISSSSRRSGACTGKQSMWTVILQTRMIQHAWRSLQLLCHSAILLQHAVLRVLLDMLAMTGSPLLLQQLLLLPPQHRMHVLLPDRPVWQRWSLFLAARQNSRARLGSHPGRCTVTVQPHSHHRLALPLLLSMLPHLSASGHPKYGQRLLMFHPCPPLLHSILTYAPMFSMLQCRDFVHSTYIFLPTTDELCYVSLHVYNGAFYHTVPLSSLLRGSMSCFPLVGFMVSSNCRSAKNFVGALRHEHR